MLGGKGSVLLFMVQIQRLVAQNTRDISLHTYTCIHFNKLILIRNIVNIASKSKRIVELCITSHTMRQVHHCYKMLWCHVGFNR